MVENVDRRVRFAPSETLIAYHRGCLIVRFHDQYGFPFEETLAIHNERGENVALLGIIEECARRNWGKARMKAIIDEWEKYNVPTAAEKLGLKFFRANYER